MKASQKYEHWFPNVSSEVTTVLEKCASSECIAQSLSRIPMKSFWPFNREVVEKNMKLGVFGITGENVEDKDLKQMVSLFAKLSLIFRSDGDVPATVFIH